MRIQFLINETDEEFAKNCIKEMRKNKNLKIGDSIMSGGLAVIYEGNAFVIYREIGEVPK